MTLVDAKFLMTSQSVFHKDNDVGAGAPQAFYFCQNAANPFGIKVKCGAMLCHIEGWKMYRAFARCKRTYSKPRLIRIRFDRRFYPM